MRTRLWLAALLMSSLTPLVASEPIKLRVSQPATAAPVNVLVQVSVEPNADNRVLRVVIDSDRYYRSSEVGLDGIQSPRTHTFDFRRMPSGSYQIRAVLVGASGKPRAFADGRIDVY